MAGTKRRATTTDERRDAHAIAAMAGVDERTAVRALRLGVDAVRGLVIRERVRAALRELHAEQHVGATFGDGDGASSGVKVGD